MQVPTHLDGRSVVRLGGRRLRPIVADRPETHEVRRRPRALGLVVLLVAAASMACSLGTEDTADTDRLGGIELGAVATTEAPAAALAAAPLVTLPEGFVVPDTRTVVIPPVLGRPKVEEDHSIPRLAIRGGTATLRGTVFGPDGPVEGATVRLERFAGDDFGREDVSTNADGRWEAKDLVGGRYKVRAWVRPDLATIDPQAVFVANESGEATLDLTIERFEGEQIQGALDIAEPAVGQVLTLRTLVSRAEVDEEGIVRGIGLEGREVQLEVLGGIRLVGEKKPLTDAEGFAAFSVVCLVAGVHSVRVLSGELTADVELPECLDGVLDLDALPPELPEFAVGATFTVPTAGPFPPGTYTATTPGTCGTSFQEFIVDRWAANVSLDRTISPTNPIRNLGSIPGSQACTFRRTA